jgi:hypothetical protein
MASGIQQAKWSQYVTKANLARPLWRAGDLNAFMQASRLFFFWN